VIGVVNITTLTNRQYCVVLDPVDAKGNPQFGRKKLVKGEKTFFLMPGERLEKGIQNMYILGEDEGLILKAVEGFVDSVRWRHVDTCCGCILRSLLLNVAIFVPVHAHCIIAPQHRNRPSARKQIALLLCSC